MDNIEFGKCSMTNQRPVAFLKNNRFYLSSYKSEFKSHHIEDHT